MMQDEAGFHNGIMSAFHVYSSATGYRREKSKEEDGPTGVARARERDAQFGDHR